MNDFQIMTGFSASLLTYYRYQLKHGRNRAIGTDMVVQGLLNARHIFLINDRV